MSFGTWVLDNYDSIMSQIKQQRQTAFSKVNICEGQQNRAHSVMEWDDQSKETAASRQTALIHILKSWSPILIEVCSNPVAMSRQKKDYVST